MCSTPQRRHSCATSKVPNTLLRTPSIMLYSTNRHMFVGRRVIHRLHPVGVQDLPQSPPVAHPSPPAAPRCPPCPPSSFRSSSGRCRRAAASETSSSSRRRGPCAKICRDSAAPMEPPAPVTSTVLPRMQVRSRSCIGGTGSRSRSSAQIDIPRIRQPCAAEDHVGDVWNRLHTHRQTRQPPPSPGAVPPASAARANTRATPKRVMSRGSRVGGCTSTPSMTWPTSSPASSMRATAVTFG